MRCLDGRRVSYFVHRVEQVFGWSCSDGGCFAAQGDLVDDGAGVVDGLDVHGGSGGAGRGDGDREECVGVGAGRRGPGCGVTFGGKWQGLPELPGRVERNYLAG